MSSDASQQHLSNVKSSLARKDLGTKICTIRQTVTYRFEHDHERRERR